MSGQELYELYTQALLKQNVHCDEWDQLDESDHRAWNEVAEQIQLKPLERI